MSLNEPPIKIGLLGFFKYTDPRCNYLTSVLSRRFNIETCLPDETGHLNPIPDILFVSVFERNGFTPQYRFWPYHQANPNEEPLSLDPRYDGCAKIFTSDENIRTPWYECDYSITSDYDDAPRHLRLPIYVNMTLAPLRSEVIQKKLYVPNPDLLKDPSQDWQSILAKKTKFCNFVYTNPRPQERIRFFNLLSKYKKVDSGGEVLNNLGHTVERDPDSNVPGKLAFLQNYKFTISFENATQPGYVTEKIAEPMVMNSMPIYWGCPRIGEELNRASFIEATGRKFEDVVEEIVELDRDDSRYIGKLKQPWFVDNVPNRYCSPDYLCDFVAKIVNTRREKNRS